MAPIYLGLDSLLTMNVFESLFWMGAAFVALKIFSGGSQRLWLLFGAICGIGLLNKHSMLFFGFGVFVGLLLTSQRKQFRKPWIWLGGLIAFLIFLPNLLWEIHRHFPTVELLRNVQQSGRNTEMGPGMFLLVQAFILHPLAVPVWIAGLIELLRDRDRKGLAGIGHRLRGTDDLHADDARSDVLPGAGVPDAVCGRRIGVRALVRTVAEVVAG